MIKLKVSPEQARSLILSIPHETCAKALDEHWRVRADGSVPASSLLWLFCWAKTGMNSEEARAAAVEVFDEIFPIRFVDCDAIIDHSYARRFRYSQQNIEPEFERRFPGLFEGAERVPGTSRERVIAISARITELRSEISRIAHLQSEAEQLEHSLDELIGAVAVRDPAGDSPDDAIALISALTSCESPRISPGEEVPSDQHPGLNWLRESFRHLSPREEKVLQLRLGFADGNEYTFEDIASRFSVSEERIREIYSRGRRRLRRHIRQTLERELPRLQSVQAR